MVHINVQSISILVLCCNLHYQNLLFGQGPLVGPGVSLTLLLSLVDLFGHLQLDYQILKISNNQGIKKCSFYSFAYEVRGLNKWNTFTLIFQLVWVKICVRVWHLFHCKWDLKNLVKVVFCEVYIISYIQNL